MGYPKSFKNRKVKNSIISTRLEEHKSSMKQIITNEEQFRAPIQSKFDMWSHRKMMIEVNGGIENCHMTFITNAGGVSGKTQSLYEVMKDISLEKLTDTLDSLSIDIKFSRTKEKFYRYCFNLDLINCNKYHKKLLTLSLETMERLAEETDDFALVMDNSINDKPYSVNKNSSGYKTYCDDQKKFNDYRIELINYIIPQFI